MTPQPPTPPPGDHEPKLPARAMQVRLSSLPLGERPEATDGPYFIERLTGLAHDLRNMMDGSIRCLALARRAAATLPAELASAETIRRQIDIASVSLERMADLVNAAMRGSASVVGSPASMPSSPITLGEGIGHAMDVLTPLAQERGVHMRLSAESNGASLPIGPLYSVVLNGLKNAIEAMPPGEGGEVVAEVRRLSDPAAEADGIEFAVVTIEDDGRGLSACEDGRRAFDYGFTSKPGGAGVGLALARAIVHEGGGSIELVPRHGRRGDRPGAVLRIMYPVLKGPGPAW